MPNCTFFFGSVLTSSCLDSSLLMSSCSDSSSSLQERGRAWGGLLCIIFFEFCLVERYTAQAQETRLMGGGGGENWVSMGGRGSFCLAWNGLHRSICIVDNLSWESTIRCGRGGRAQPKEEEILCHRDRYLLRFLLHFWTDLTGPRKNVTCPFSIEPKLTELKIREVLLALSTKMLTKFLEAPSHFFQVGNWVRSLLAMPMVHPITGETISSYKRLMHDPTTAETWQMAFRKFLVI